MRFHFASHPVSKKADKEEIAVEFRDSLQPSMKAPGVVITWDRSSKGDWENPYVELLGEPNIVLAQAKIIRALNGFCENGEIDMTDPDRLLSLIEKAGGEHVVLPNGGREYTPVRKINSETSKWRAMAADGSVLLVVNADDESDAKAELGKRLMQLTDEDPNTADQVATWIKAGKPVKKVEKNGDTKIHPLDAYTKRGHQRAAQELKEKTTGKKIVIATK